MVFGFFSLSRRNTVAGSTEEQDSAPNDAPEVQPEPVQPQPIPVETTSSTEGTTSSTQVPDEATARKPVSLKKAQSKAAFAYWKEREKHLNSPAPSATAAVATPPPPTPTPPPPELVTDPTPLYTLISSVPAQTLRSYCLSHLNPAKFPPPPSASPKSRRRKSGVPQVGNPASAIISRKGHRKSQSGPSHAEDGEEEHKEDKDPLLSPETLTTLTQFFRTLEPPPQLHCVRCHKDYFELENTDTSCRVPHDDDSTIVERVGVSVVGDTATYETLWGCCGKTVEGDGDQGPPDGWCYEGLHTVDTRRARFRADSTPQDDKLISCHRKRCANPVVHSDSDGESDRQSVPQSKRKRRKSMAVEEGDDGKSVASEPKKRKRNTKKVQEEEEDAKSVASEPKKRRTRAKKAVVSAEELQTEDDDQMEVDDEYKPAVPATPASPKRGRGRPPKSTTTRTPKPRSKAGDASPAPRASGSVPVVEIRRSSRSPVRPSGSKLKKQVNVVAQEEEEEEEEETHKVLPAKTPRKRGRPRKSLAEVVDSSIAAENEMQG